MWEFRKVCIYQLQQFKQFVMLQYFSTIKVHWTVAECQYKNIKDD